MPYAMSDAPHFTKKADTPAKKKQFASTANAALKGGYTEGQAIRIANAAVKKHPSTAATKKRAAKRKK